MMYLSKGLPAHSPHDGETRISLYGTSYALGPRLAALWNVGRSMPRVVSPGNAHRVHRMAQCGLAVRTEERNGKLASYRLLSQCIPCPNPEPKRRIPLILSRDKRIWTWLSSAGLRLTACELIRLEEQRLRPEPALLGEGHRQALVEAIYRPHRR